jgi:hypothetical protein
MVLTVRSSDKELNLEHWCGPMLELWKNITKSKRLHSYKNNGNMYLTVVCLVKVQKLKHYSFLMLAGGQTLQKTK